MSKLLWLGLGAVGGVVLYRALWPSKTTTVIATGTPTGTSLPAGTQSGSTAALTQTIQNAVKYVANGASQIDMSNIRKDAQDLLDKAYEGQNNIPPQALKGIGWR